MNICSFENCGKEVRYKNLCSAHYNQQNAGKSLKPLQVQHHGLSESDRFMCRVNKNELTGCWNWTGSRKNKNWHGQWRNANNDIELAHRASWRMYVGEIEDSKCVCHKCDNPACVNPDHLFLGTQTENMNDMYKKGRGRQGVSKGEKHGMSKLTAEIVNDIRNSNLTGIELANKFSVSPTTICDILKRRSWNHI